MVSGKNWRYERWRWQTFGITWLAYFGFYLTRKSFSVAKIGIDQDPTTNISLSQMAWVDGAYLIAYAVGQFVWGMTADKVGTRRVVLCGMFGSVAAAAAMGASSITLALGALFCFQGICQSTGWAPLTMNIGNFFSRNERGTVMGFWCTNFAMGGLVASAYAGYWGDRLGWRFAFFVPAATLLVIWFLFLLLQRNRPQDVGLPPIEQYHQQQTPEHKDEAPQLETEGSWKTLFAVISNPTILALGAVYFLLKPTRYAILFWGPKYINSKLGTNMTESGIIGGMFEAAGIVSILLAGWISDRVFQSRRMPVCVICLLLLCIVIFFLDDLPANPVMLGGGLLLMGFLLFGPDSILTGAAAIDFGTKKGASTATGFVNGCGSVGAIIGGTIPGLFVEKWGWNGVFTLLAGMVLLAGLILAPMWNTLPKKE